MVPEDTLADVNSHFAAARTDLSEKVTALSTALASVSDIISVATPDSSNFDLELDSTAEVARTLSGRVDEHEAFHVAAFSAFDDIVALIEQSLVPLRETKVSLSSTYVPGSAASILPMEELGAAYMTSAARCEARSQGALAGYNNMLLRLAEQEEAYRQAQEEAEWTWVDWGHCILDVAGLVPGYGEVADGANGIWYAIEGDWATAGLCAAACIPFVGWVCLVKSFFRKCASETFGFERVAFAL